MDRLVATQQGRPYANSVEVAKEGSALLPLATRALCSALRLLALVLDNAVVRADRTRRACERSGLGSFSLANRLTLVDAIPWRKAQVIAGRYFLAQDGSRRSDRTLLTEISAAYGYDATTTAGELDSLMDVDEELRRRGSAGSAQPAVVRGLLDVQGQQLDELETRWTVRSDSVTAALRALDEAAALHAGMAGR